MSTILNLASQNNPAIVKNTTYYWPVNDGILPLITTESQAQATWRVAGILSNLYLRLTANTVTATSTLRLRKNTANGNMSCSIASSTTGEFEDTSNTDVVVAGDVLNYSLATGATGTGMTAQSCSTLFAANSNTVKRWGQSSASTTYTGASTSNYTRIVGNLATSTTESTWQVTANCAGTCQNAAWRAITNGRSTTSTITFRKNTANGNMALSVASSTTGEFEDTSNTDTIAVNDLVNWVVVLGTGTGNLILTVGGCDFVTLDSSTSLIVASGASGVTQNASVTAYQSIDGNGTGQSTELNAEAKGNMAATLSLLEVYVTANTIVGASTLATRLNAGAGAQSASITSLTTGTFSDAVNSDTIVATDELNLQLVTAAAGTSLVFRYMAVKVKCPFSTEEEYWFNRPAPSIPEGVVSLWS